MNVDCYVLNSPDDWIEKMDETVLLDVLWVETVQKPESRHMNQQGVAISTATTASHGGPDAGQSQEL